MTYRRTALKQFSLANPAYANAVVSFYGVNVDTQESTGVLATLYDGVSGTGQLPNPYTLDANGRTAQVIYHQSPVIAQIDQATAPDHETGVIYPYGGVWKGDWVASTFYSPGDVIVDGSAGSGTENIYICVTEHTSTASFASDLGNSRWDLQIDTAQISADAATATTKAAEAAASASAALTSETNAAVSETSAAADAVTATNAANSLADFRHFDTTGSGNAYVGNLNPDTTLTDDSVYRIKANHGNTGAATLNIDGLGAKPIKKFYNQDLQVGDFQSGGYYWITYDSTNDVFQLMTSLAQATVAQLSDLSDANITALADNEVLLSSSGVFINRTFAEADLPSLTNLASNANGVGASLIGIEDSGSIITATNVELALAEIQTDLNAVEADYLTEASDYGLWTFGFYVDAPIVKDGIIRYVVPSELNGRDVLSAKAQWQGDIGTGAASQFQIYNETDSVDIFSAVISIGDGSRQSGASPSVANSELATNDVLRFDCDQIGSTIPGTFLHVEIQVR